MRAQSERGRVFKLIWILDLVSESSKTWVNLVFQNVKTHFILIDSIPPELLSYCTVGSYFQNGKKFLDTPEGISWDFSITSNQDSLYQEAHRAFTDCEYNLTLNHRYTDICWQQHCFIQQVDRIKIVIPCFVIAATYYFRSTSLREAILSRKVPTLCESCSVDDFGHAEIHLKSGANLGDARIIAKLLLDPFARARLNLCKNFHYTTNDKAYSRIYVQFPVEQTITMKARGIYTEENNGSGTFVVCQIEKENSAFPFTSIEVYYQGHEKSATPEQQGTFPTQRKKHNNRMTNRSPSSNLVRHLLENSDIAQNEFLDSIIEYRIAVPKCTEDLQPVSTTDDSDNHVDLSSQLDHPGEHSTAKAEIEEKEKNRTKFEFSLEDFIQMVSYLQGSHIVTVGRKQIQLEVTNFSVTQSDVPLKYEDTEKVSIRESYDHTPKNRRRYATIRFECNGRHICIVEIDQTGIGNARCSTKVLIANEEILDQCAVDCVKDYVNSRPLKARQETLKKEGIRFLRKNHPQRNDEVLKAGWRRWMLAELASSGQIFHS
ncbi:MAG: hypothetical protein JW915_10470 [Chitinispirillaceae bacterium]|nr:hypothetical protein [Chitinispirillaceae bacterium]